MAIYVNGIRRDGWGGVAAFEQRIAGIESTVSEHTTSISTLNQTATSITTRVTSIESTVSKHTTNISSLNQTATSITTRVTSIESTVSSHTTSISTLNQTATSITTRVTSIESTVSSHTTSISTLNQTASSITMTVASIQTTVSGHTTSISSLSQTASKISWLVKSGTSSTNFELTDRVATLIASAIKIDGYVTFTDLSTVSTKTTINGGNITTGEIDANKVKVKNLKVSEIYDYNGTNMIVYTSGSTLHIGGKYYSNFYEINLLTNKFGIGHDSLFLDNFMIDTVSRIVRPGSTSYGWSLGNSTYRFDNGYFKQLDAAGNCYICGNNTKDILSFFGASGRSCQELHFTYIDTETPVKVTIDNYLFTLNNLVDILGRRYGLFKIGYY